MTVQDLSCLCWCRDNTVTHTVTEFTDTYGTESTELYILYSLREEKGESARCIAFSDNVIAATAELGKTKKKKIIPRHSIMLQFYNLNLTVRVAEYTKRLNAQLNKLRGFGN